MYRIEAENLRDAYSLFQPQIKIINTKSLFVFTINDRYTEFKNEGWDSIEKIVGSHSMTYGVS